ncbi:MAG: DUF2244 domain-containing protein [Burkholderiales bacterium]
MTNPVFQFATVSAHGVHWLLRRNCSIAPAQLGWIYLVLCVVSLVIAAGFWFQGAKLILPFAGLELVMVGVAFLVYARHATDREQISLLDRRLVVELESAGRLERVEFDRDWVRIEPSAADTSLIEVSGRGARPVQVGRFIRPELRPLLARELRMAVLSRSPSGAAFVGQTAKGAT